MNVNDDDAKAECSKSSASQRGKGFAFVWMWNRREAETAMHTRNGMPVHTGLATDLIKDKQKRKKTLRQEKKQVKASKGLDDPGRIIAVDWALSKDKWEEEKMHLDSGTSSDSQSEQGDDEEDTDDSQAVADEPEELVSDSREESSDEASEVDDDGEVVKPNLPQPEAGTTLFVRNVPFIATEDELRGLCVLVC